MSTRSHGVNTRANHLKGDSVTWVGASCGRHGSYIFYKAFRFHQSKPSLMTSPKLSVLVRSRTRERRNTLSDSDKTPEATSPDDECDERILSLGEFFFVQCRPEDPVCVGELQLLWHDKHSGQDLSSTRLYYLPETTPAGRASHHGQDEVVAVSDKVVMRTCDLASWVVEPDEWNYGSSLPLIQAPSLANFHGPSPSASTHRFAMLRSCVNMDDVKLEKQLLMVNRMCQVHRCQAEQLLNDKVDKLSNPSNNQLGKVEEHITSSISCKDCSSRNSKAQVLVLSLTAYCRHKAVMKRIEGTNPDWLSKPEASQSLASLGAYTSSNSKLRTVFCRESFDYSQLFEHDLICEEFAPVFKGRPRKKTKKSNQLSGKVTSKKTNLNEDGRNGGTLPSENNETHPDIKMDSDSARNNRRRSKRRLQQRSSDDEGFTPTCPRLNKRVRRGSPYDPSVVGLHLNQKNPTSRSEPSSPTDSRDSESGRRRRGGRRTRPSDLSIALRNSLLENHKVKEDLKKRSSSSADSSSGSSRSSSPAEESASNDTNKHHSSSDSVSSASSLPSEMNNVRASPGSSSPVDFSMITPSTPNDNYDFKKDLDLTSEANMYLRGLSEGHLPENRSEFLELLYQFMRKQNTPIGRIPSLGFKKLDLWTFFKLSQEYGGYDMVTAKRLWKHVYDRMGGNPSCTSAATCTRKHFEKLLLPLEKYLRKALRNKDLDLSKVKSDEGAVVANSESSSLSSLNGRTFDGDVYFHNSAAIVDPSSTFSDTPAKPTITETSSVPTTTSSDDTTLTTPTKAPLLPVTTQAPPSFAPRGINLESIVNQVVSSQFMENKSMKDEILLNKLAKSDGNTDNAPVELIDLTDAARRPPIKHVPPSTNSYTSPHTPHISSRPKPTTIFTKPYCPRNSIIPPPFIPKPPPPKSSLLSKPSVDKLTSSSSSYAARTPAEQTYSPREGASNQKRHTDFNQSPSSPKRPRDSLPPEQLPSNRRFLINNLVSTSSDKSRDHQDMPALYKIAPSNGFKHEALEPKGFGIEQRPKQSSSGSVMQPRGTTTHDPFKSKPPPLPATISESVLRMKPEGSSSNPLKSSSRRYQSPMDDRKSYYRPNGMLATHRERQQQVKSSTSIGGDERRYRTDHVLTSERVAPPSRPPASLGKEVEARTLSSKPTHLPTTRPDPTRGFPTSFSIDRLTSHHGRQSMSNGSSEVGQSKDSRPPHSVAPIHSAVPRYVDPRQVGYRQVTEKDSYRSSSGIAGSSSRSESQPKYDRGATSEGYNATVRSLPNVTASTSSAAAHALRSMLDSHSSQLPPSCTSSNIDHYMPNKLPFLRTATLHPSLLATPALTQFPVLPESLLRGDSVLRRQQEQLLAAELTRTALPLTPNDISLLMLQSYQQLAINQLTGANLSQLPNPSLTFPLPSRAPGPASKHSNHPDLPVLSQTVRIGAPATLQQTPPLLVSKHQQPHSGAPDIRGLPFPYSRR